MRTLEPSTVVAPRISAQIAIRLGEFHRQYTLHTTTRTLGITGPSGAGKSVFLKILAGVEPNAVGTVIHRDTVWQASAQDLFVPPWERHVGWVPQDALLFPHRTVRGNLHIAATAAADPSAVDTVAQLLGVSHLLDRTPRHLSGGERQRVALGRALLAQPALLLLDEPFAALDTAMRERIATRLHEWLQQHDITTVLVSHYQEELTHLCDQTIELREPPRAERE